MNPFIILYPLKLMRERAGFKPTINLQHHVAVDCVTEINEVDGLRHGFTTSKTPSPAYLFYLVYYHSFSTNIRYAPYIIPIIKKAYIIIPAIPDSCSLYKYGSILMVHLFLLIIYLPILDP